MDNRKEKIERLTMQDKYKFMVCMVSSFWDINNFKHSIQVINKVEQQLKELEDE